MRSAGGLVEDGLASTPGRNRRRRSPVPFSLPLRTAWVPLGRAGLGPSAPDVGCERGAHRISHGVRVSQLHVRKRAACPWRSAEVPGGRDTQPQRAQESRGGVCSLNLTKGRGLRWRVLARYNEDGSLLYAAASHLVLTAGEAFPQSWTTVIQGIGSVRYGFGR